MLKKISISILAGDFSRIADEMLWINETDIDAIHLDIMDGNFVPNISFGAKFIETIRSLTSKKLETHLMINNPEKHVKDFINAGSDTIVFHCESTSNIGNLISTIKACNRKLGIAIKPETDIEMVKPYLSEIDEVLVMTVRPGFCGQVFDQSQLYKVEALYRHNHRIDIGVDGGITPKTIGLAAKYGANLAIAGSFLFANKRLQQNISILRKELIRYFLAK